MQKVTIPGFLGFPRASQSFPDRPARPPEGVISHFLDFLARFRQKVAYLQAGIHPEDQNRASLGEIGA